MRIPGVYAYRLKIKACEKFYRRHINDIRVRVYARRVLTSEDNILSIKQSLGEKIFLQVAQYILIILYLI